MPQSKVTADEVFFLSSEVLVVPQVEQPRRSKMFRDFVWMQAWVAACPPIVSFHLEQLPFSDTAGIVPGLTAKADQDTATVTLT